MLPPSWKSEVQKTVEEAADRDADKRKASEAEKSAAITSPLYALVNQLEGQERRGKRPKQINILIGAVTLILVAATAVFTGLAWWVFRGQLHVFQEQLSEMQKVYTPIKQSADAAKEAANAANVSNRAWIAPRYVSVNGSIKDGEPSQFGLFMKIPGKLRRLMSGLVSSRALSK